MVHNIFSWIILFFQIVPWIAVVGGLLVWFINRQTTNIKWKYLSSLWVIIALIVIYLFRFVPLLVMSYLESMKVNSGDASEMFKGLLTVIQLLIVAVVWKFAQIQSTIFYYQQIITENEKHSSGLQRRFFLFGGIAITVLTVGIIEMLKFIM